MPLSDERLTAEELRADIRAPLLINTRKRKRPGTGPQGPSDNPQSGTNTKTQTQKGPPGFLFKKRVNNKMVKKDLVKRDYEDREHGDGDRSIPGNPVRLRTKQLENSASLPPHERYREKPHLISHA